MDAFFLKVGEWVIGQGTFAILCAVLAVRLWQRENELTAVNAARLSETRENIKALTESTLTLRQVAEAQTNAAEASREMGESLRLMQAAFERLAR